MAPPTTWNFWCIFLPPTYTSFQMIFILWFLGCCLSQILCNPGNSCEEKEPSVIICKSFLVSSKKTPPYNVQVEVIHNECHHPTDVTFIVKSVENSWSWKHTFINDDEVHQVSGPDLYTLLRVQISRQDNSSALIKANFAVNGEKQESFLTHNFTTSTNITCSAAPLEHIYSDVKDLLPLIIFVTLCLLIILTLTVFCLWYHLRKRPKQVNRKCRSPLRSSSRPVSSTYSYEDEDYINDIDKKKVPMRDNNTKSCTTMIRNSIYRESLLVDDSSHNVFTYDDDIKFSSLPRHLGKNTFGPGHDDLCAEYESRTLPRKNVESPWHPREISAKEYLNINSGSSQPHYSATLFQSFRGNQSSTPKKPKPKKSPGLYHSSSSLSNISGQTSNSMQKQKVSKRKQGKEDTEKRLSSVRLLNDHDHLDDSDYEANNEDNASDSDPLKSKF